jgi:hypothetical protein
MRYIVCLALLVPIMALAAGTTTHGLVVAPGVSLQVMNELPGDGSAGPPGPQSSPGPSRPARFTIGTVDTVGGTTYDYATNGPAYRMLIATPGKGVHVLFMWSQATDTLFVDRDMRYNFYDFSNRAWNWTDPDFMQSGVGVFAERTGYGNIEVDGNGAAVISAHHRTGSSDADFAPIIARDADIGAGIFEYVPGESSAINYYEWPYLAINDNGTYQLAMIDANNQDNLYWSRMTTWGTWEAAVSIPAPKPEPLSPTHNIATSKVSGSNKVCITWVGTPASGYQQDPGFYRESQDGGNNWDAPVEIGFPLTFHPGSETVPSYDVSSLFPFYDRNNNLHIVGNVTPYVRDTNWVLPGQIWHWCTANPDTWDLVHIASPDSWMASCGGHAVVCCRPSLGQDGNGNLFVAWEEFDGVNVEPTTSRLRADIWYSYSTDNGVSWHDGIKITDGGDVTYRFPSILNPIADTVMVTYIIDQVAGFFVQSAEGAATYNPVVVQKWPNPTAIAEGPMPAPPARMELAAGPSPARGRTVISYSLPRVGDMSLVVYDVTGRPVQALASGRRAAGRYTVTWNASGAAAGIYFCTLESGGRSTSRKIVLSE